MKRRYFVECMNGKINMIAIFSAGDEMNAKYGDLVNFFVLRKNQQYKMLIQKIRKKKHEEI